MTTRTISKTVTFRRPFVLDGLDEELPAGDYVVETDEERLESFSFVAYRRILTVIRLGGEPAHPGRVRVLTIEPEALEDALRRDLADIPPEPAAASGAVS